MTHKPNPIDIHVGKRMRMRRKMLELSQTALGKTVGLSFQQIQKYERGDNRVSASMLYYIARTLKVPVEFFYGGLETPDSPVLSREAMKIVSYFEAIESPAIRKSLCLLAKTVAEEGDG